MSTVAPINVTATVTSGTATATGVTGLGKNERNFLSQVIAWPAPNEPGYGNLHFMMPSKKDPKTKIMTGWPFRDVATFVQRAAWALSTDNIKDMFFCTSLQSQSGKNSKGNPKAVRGAMLALNQKSIWIDMDVGPNDPKKYGTVNEALAAILMFQETVGLPAPSTIVFSGGGIHVYWISKAPLTSAEWAPYASGLKSLLLANGVKCDSGLTTDIARILRVPGTFNHKYDPPKPVRLSPSPSRFMISRSSYRSSKRSLVRQPHQVKLNLGKVFSPREQTSIASRAARCSRSRAQISTRVSSVRKSCSRPNRSSVSAAS
jgi:hypothetical protein